MAEISLSSGPSRALGGVAIRLASSRHAGALDHVGHDDPRVSPLGHRLHHRIQHASALGLPDHRPGRRVTPAREHRTHGRFGLDTHGNTNVHWRHDR